MLTVTFPEPCTAPETAHSQPGISGSMVQLKLIVPRKWPMDATATSAVVVEPGGIRTVESETDSWKSDPHSSRKFETSKESTTGPRSTVEAIRGGVLRFRASRGSVSIATDSREAQIQQINSRFQT